MKSRFLFAAAFGLGVACHAPVALAGDGLSRKVDSACDQNDDGKISEKEFDDKKCQRKVVGVMANFQRELALLGEDGATKLVDALAGEGKGKSKKERREDAMKCLVKAAEVAVATAMGKADGKRALTNLVESDAFRGCYAIVSPQTLSKLSNKLDGRIEKVSDARTTCSSRPSRSSRCSCFDAPSRTGFPQGSCSQTRPTARRALPATRPGEQAPAVLSHDAVVLVPDVGAVNPPREQAGRERADGGALRRRQRGHDAIPDRLTGLEAVTRHPVATLPPTTRQTPADRLE